MYASWFRYSLTKPYPLPWFTPVVVVGGIILTAVFSFLTVATSGYSLQSFYTTFPNATLDQQFWFTKAPFAWRGSLSPTCQPREIPIGSKFFTSNLGFQHELTSVAKVDPTKQRTTAWLPSLPYLNQVLTDCKVIDITLSFSKVDLSADGSGSWWSWSDGSAVSRANCSVATEVGNFVAVYTTTYKVPLRDFSYVVQTDFQANTSMWWATRLINAYYFSTMVALSAAESNSNDDNTIWMKASMTFTTNQTADIKSYNLFSLANYFIGSGGGIENSVDADVSQMYNDPDSKRSASLTQGLSFAKTMYSAILVDLGQANSSNLLLEPSLLQWILQHPDDKFRNDPDFVLNCTTQDCYFDYGGFNTLAGPENLDNSYVSEDYNNAPAQNARVLMSEAFDQYKPNSSGPGSLGTRETTIYMQYSCYVPVHKNGGAIFLTVLVAVLVYLRAAWSLLTIVAKTIVERKDPAGANTCFTDPSNTNMFPGPNDTAYIGIGQSSKGHSRSSPMHGEEDGDRLIALEPIRDLTGNTDRGDHSSLKSGFVSERSIFSGHQRSGSTASLTLTEGTAGNDPIQHRPHTTSASRAYHRYLHNTSVEPRRDDMDDGIGRNVGHHSYERLSGA